MDINFIGIGSAFYVEMGSNAAYIKENDKLLLIDVGLDTFQRIIKNNIFQGIKEIYILITHLHSDHVGGLPTLAQYVYFFLETKVKILNNSNTFTNDLNQIFKLTGVPSDQYEFINKEGLPFTFNINLKKTTHTPWLECYSIIFEKNNRKTIYTSDSSDIEFVKECIKDENVEKIYAEVGENVEVHLDYKDLKLLNKEKLVLMHIQGADLHKKIIQDGFKIAQIK